MNKKECERAYADLEVCREVMRESIERNGEIINPVSSFDKAMVMFARLIEDHFDNPPLKFEELKEKTWYWHNPSKSWIYLFKPLNWEPEKGLRYAERIIDHSAEGCYMPFKTGTLFRKQVEE